jgi:histone H3/H4
VARNGLPLAPMYRICKKSGAERRSKSATRELAKTLEEIGVKIAADAFVSNFFSLRTLCKDRDVKLAARKIISDAHPRWFRR